MTAPEQPRWLYRFDNFSRAVALLREAVGILREREMSALEKEGMVQRFEFTWELGWKLLKDYLEHAGVVLDVVTPAATIRAAFTARIIAEGEVWMQALDARKRRTHTYDRSKFDLVVVEIADIYFPVLDRLHQRMAREAGHG